MLPIGDDNPTMLTPYVNWAIILSCILAFLWQTSEGTNHFIYTLMNFGIVPARIAAGEGLYTFVTNIFLHGGWAHLLGNMLFLWIFGDNIEDCCGHMRYLLFYILTGVIASALWLATAWGSPYPAVGASGAISGVLGAYFVLFPGARVRTIVGFGFIWRVIRLRAWTMIGFWAAYQFLLASVALDTGVAYWAHVGGFVAGIFLSKIFQQRLRKPTADYNDLDYYR